MTDLEFSNMSEFEHLCYYNLDIESSEKYFYSIFSTKGTFIDSNIVVWKPFRNELKKLTSTTFKRFHISLDRRNYILESLNNLSLEVANKNSYKSRRRKADFEISIKRDKVLELHGSICLCCGSDKKITIDHIIPVFKGGGNDINNLQPLCHRCNSSKRIKIIDYRL